MLEILKKKPNQKISLDMWLYTINQELTPQIMFGSKKELAKVFRYIKCTMKERLEKTRECVISEDLKAYNTYYSLNQVEEEDGQQCV